MTTKTIGNSLVGSKKILTVNNFNVTYKNKSRSVYAVKDVNFSINKGDSLGIAGESGSGKSTLAMAILRLLPDKTTEMSGRVYFLERNLLKLNDEEVRGLRWSEMAVVLQKSMNSLSPVHRIGTQVEDIYKVHKPDAEKKEIYDKFSHLLNLVNLSNRIYNLYPHEISGGMLQRVSIAISLIHNPKLLVLDEATTALDVVTQGQILDEILKMESEFDMTRIMITHDLSVVATSCNKAAIMYAGELMEIGKTNNVLLEPMHPYTKDLLSSFPSLKGEKTVLKGIKGYLPDLSKTYDGCIYSFRCKYAKDVCFKYRPHMINFNNAQSVRCFLYEEGADLL